VVALNSARTKARDARRQADVHQIQSALEMFNSSNGSGYPVFGTATDIGSSTTYYICADTGVQTTVCTSSSNLLMTVPKAPTPIDGTAAGCGIGYKLYSSSTSYYLTYCLSSSTASPATATPAGVQ
ncbi:MAG: hypothetical protein NT165_00040, partial [Candidatus Falkowbacteria bacterium]|nr:hypothetical protein [Candidatus Falkowbacteria bacterium]